MPDLPSVPTWFHTPGSLTVVLDFAPDGVILEQNDTVIYANAAYASQLGYTSSELVGQSVSSIVAPSDRHRLLTYAEHRIKGIGTPSRYAFSALRKDGRPALVHASVSVVPLADGSIILTTIRPETDELSKGSDEPRLLESLTRREREVIGHILDGMTPKAMALAMSVSVKTIATFRSRAFSKLSIQSTRDLICFGLRCGLIVC